jgi:predicted amidohydrolase
VLLNIAHFPEVRIKAIEPLIRARAIENMAYGIFVNRDGDDPMCKYCPSSQMYDYKGSSISTEVFLKDCTGSNTQLLSCDIDVEELNEFRFKFPAWMDADTFNVIR